MLISIPLFLFRFACSVSVSTVPGISKEKEIVLQGNYGFEIENYLVDYCGIPRHVIEVAAGKGAKLKKK
jgi:translation initiation factor 1 (eIF-1/SUI1)